MEGADFKSAGVEQVRNGVISTPDPHASWGRSLSSLHSPKLNGVRVPLQKLFFGELTLIISFGSTL